MKCPFCHKDDNQVIETRASEDDFSIRRRRHCRVCRKRFTTYERIEVVNVRVIKRDKSRVPFDRSKLREGIERACWKRPVTDAQISELVAKIESRLERETEISSKELGELTMNMLRELDDVAFIRFASVYYQFNSVEDFSDALKKLKLQ